MKDQPAFPSENNHISPEGMMPDKGLTKREYFAGLAMAALVEYPFKENGKTVFRTCAESSIEYADALIKELEQE